MRDLSLLTSYQVNIIGNNSFRIFKKGSYKELYQSDDWKLHLFLDKKGRTQKIAIVDEITPLAHIDDLFTEADIPYSLIGGHYTPARPRYNFIEITKELAITHYHKFDQNMMLETESQYHIFQLLDKWGFMGEKMVLWEETFVK